jgi:hypothetical protein
MVSAFHWPRMVATGIIGVATTAACYLSPNAVAATSVVSTTTAIPCANFTYRAPTDWYFPASAPVGLVWMQHGFVENKQVWSSLASQIAESKEVWSAVASRVADRGYLVVATTLPTVNLFGCTVENLGNNSGFLDNIADVFATKDDPTGPLAVSFASAAAKAGRPARPLPNRLVFVGHSAGVEAVEYVAEHLHTSYPPTFAQLRGLVSEDGVKSFIGSNTDDALSGLSGTTVLIYATASRSYLCNAFQSGTKAIKKYLAGRPFLGVNVTTGVHGDALGPSSPFYENLVCGFPRDANVDAVWQLTQGWITDMFSGTTTPDFYPGGALYTALQDGDIISTLP